MRKISLEVERAGLSKKLQKDMHLRVVHSFVQGVKWMAGLYQVPTSGRIVDEAKRRLLDGTLEVDELSLISCDVDFCKW